MQLLVCIKKQETGDTLGALLPLGLKHIQEQNVSVLVGQDYSCTGNNILWDGLTCDPLFNSNPPLFCKDLGYGGQDEAVLPSCRVVFCRDTEYIVRAKF